MGYLSDNLPQRKEQIVECPKLYTLVLRVRRRSPFHAMIAGETEDSIGKIIRGVVPDPEDWQFGGSFGTDFAEFRFHLTNQRERARQELLFKGYYTELVNE
jgi:hypothetical protein